MEKIIHLPFKSLCFLFLWRIVWILQRKEGAYYNPWQNKPTPQRTRDKKENQGTENVLQADPVKNIKIWKHNKNLGRKLAERRRYKYFRNVHIIFFLVYFFCWSLSYYRPLDVSSFFCSLPWKYWLNSYIRDSQTVHFCAIYCLFESTA